MTWFVRGTESDIVFCISETGNQICYGGGKHELSISGTDDDSYGANIDDVLLQRVTDAGCRWKIVMNSADKGSFDCNADGMFERVQISPTRPYGMIKFYNHASDVLSFIITLPERTLIRWH